MSKPQQGFFIRVNVHQSSDFKLAVPAVALRIFADTSAEEVSLCRLPFMSSFMDSYPLLGVKEACMRSSCTFSSYLHLLIARHLLCRALPELQAIAQLAGEQLQWLAGDAHVHTTLGSQEGFQYAPAGRHGATIERVRRCVASSGAKER